jgi:hypothetical protein
MSRVRGVGTRNLWMGGHGKERLGKVRSSCSEERVLTH